MLTRQRCTVVALVSTAAAAGALRLLGRWWSTTGSGADTAVVDLCLAALAIATGWAWLSTTSAVVEAWRGRPSGRRTLLRRAVLVCCGVALAAPVSAAVADHHHPAPASIDGLPLPDRAVGPAHHRTATGPHPAVRLVRPGDCLWHLAQADLPAGASAAQVTTRWRAIYRLNRAVIGPDPDLIQPGQRLVLPPR